MGLDDEIGHSFGFKGCPSLRSAHIKFFKKKKKEKKESRLSSGGFKKVKFFLKKILPQSSLELEA